MKKIMVVGVGGVGGVLAANLVKKYGESVSLIARGPRKESLRQNGLTLHSDLYGEFTVHPACIEEDPALCGVQDLILICVKNGGLQKVCQQILPVVGEHTAVMAVMNGVSAGQELAQRLGKGVLVDSVIYTVSSAGSDYSITQKGSYTYLNIGSHTDSEEGKKAAQEIADLLNAAGVDCKVSRNVQAAIWKKYVLNCAFNVATARWGYTIGQLAADAAKRADCRALMAEAAAVAAKMGVPLPEDLVDKHMVTMMENTTPSSDSSLSRDFDAGKVGEMEVFSGYIVRKAAELGVPAPVSREYYEGLKARAAGFI